MKHSNKLLVSLCITLLAVFSLATANAKSYYKSDFTKDAPEWTGYNEVNKVKITRTIDKRDKFPLLRFEPQGGTWNLLILTIPSGVRISETTMIRFKLKTPIPFLHQMELRNRSEGTTYQLPFLVNATNEWVSVQKYLRPATFLNAESQNSKHDGLLRDDVDRFVLKLWGEPIEIAEIEVFDSDGTLPELPEDAEQKDINAYQSTYKLKEYPILQRNGIFPYGAVLRMDANLLSEEKLGYPVQDSLQDNLADMRRHYLNTYINFCETTPVELRIEATSRNKIHLIDTRYANTKLGDLKDDSQEWLDFDKLKKHPFLLAWYGTDEPLPGSYADYVKSKAAVEKRDGTRPFVSAFNTPLTREKLGPSMEIIMPDIYSLKPDTKNSAEELLSHFNIIREAKQQSAGHAVWFITQTFSNRIANNQWLWRYPTPEEIRLDLFSNIAAGSNGIFFFIYNERIPYWKQATGETFDYTLVDPWGNGNSVYDEIANFGEKITPIMPSFLNAKPTQNLQITTSGKLLIGELTNEMGTLIIPVNPNLSQIYNGKFEVALPDNQLLFDLQTLKVASGELTLKAGEGAILVMTTSEKFKQLEKEINTRRETIKQELAELRKDELKAAGFENEATPEYLNAEQILLTLRAEFGEIHKLLIAPKVIIHADGKSEFQPLHQRLGELSKEYFAMRQQIKKGLIPSSAEFSKLKNNLKILTNDYKKLIKQY